MQEQVKVLGIRFNLSVDPRTLATTVTWPDIRGLKLKYAKGKKLNTDELLRHITGHISPREFEKIFGRKLFSGEPVGPVDV